MSEIGRGRLLHRSYSASSEKMAGWILGGMSLVLTSGIVLWYLGDSTQFIEHRLGLNSEAFNNPSAWLFAFIIMISYIMYTAWAVPFVKEHLFTFSWLKVIGIWAAFASGIMEEILFRQMLMDWLMSLNYSVIMQVLASGIIFGVAHGAWIFLRGEFKIALPVILSTTVLGGMLAVLYILSGRNIFAPIVVHIIINLFIEPWLILSAVSGNWDNKREGDKLMT